MQTTRRLTSECCDSAVRLTGVSSRSYVGPVPARPEPESALVGVNTLVFLLSFGFKGSNLARATLFSVAHSPATSRHAPMQLSTAPCLRSS